MTRWRLYYHVIWTTQARAPLIGHEIEMQLHREIARKAVELKTSILAINGMPDHIHLVATIPPTVAPMALIEALKKRGAQYMQTALSSPFAWDDGFGIVTVGKLNLEKIIEYVHHQKEHHTAHTTIASLETSSSEDDGPDPDDDLRA